MIYLKLDELKAGMLLAKPVFNHQELLLLETGAKITVKNIRMFKSWGIAAIWVKSDFADDDSEDVRPDAESQGAIELELKEKFVEVLDNPVMLEIMRAASSVLSQRINEIDEEP